MRSAGQIARTGAGGGETRARSKSEAQFTPAPRSLFYCRESVVRIDIARLYYKCRIGAHQIESGHLSIFN